MIKFIMRSRYFTETHQIAVLFHLCRFIEVEVSIVAAPYAIVRHVFILLQVTPVRVVVKFQNSD